MAIAISGDGWATVFDGDEAAILSETNQALASLDPGVLVTWNGARFDLPFIDDRSKIAGVDIGLRLTADVLTRSTHDPLPGHAGGYWATWHQHVHLDAYRAYRSDVGAMMGLPCGLKSLARFVGITPVEVERERIHELKTDELHAYVSSDAIITRQLALQRWATASRHIDALP